MLKFRIFRSVWLHSISSPPHYNTDCPRSSQDPHLRMILLYTLDFYWCLWKIAICWACLFDLANQLLVIVIVPIFRTHDIIVSMLSRYIFAKLKLNVQWAFLCHKDSQWSFAWIFFGKYHGIPHIQLNSNIKATTFTFCCSTFSFFLFATMSHRQNHSTHSFGALDPNLLGSASKDNEAPVLRCLKWYRIPSSDEDMSEVKAVESPQKSLSAVLVGPVCNSLPFYVFHFILLTFFFLLARQTSLQSDRRCQSHYWSLFAASIHWLVKPSQGQRPCGPSYLDIAWEH